MPSIVCSTCTREYQVKPELAGKKAKCKCGNTIRFPELAAAGAAVSRSPKFEALEFSTTPTASASAPARSIARPTASDNTFPCANCKAPLALNTVLCMNCGYNQKTRSMARTRVEAAPLVNAAPARTPTASSGGGDSSGMKNMLIGGIVCGVGIAITIGTYSAASTNGGSYYVFYGPVIWGGIQFLRGVGQMMSGG